MSTKTFFTADQHYNHYNIIKYCNCPFSSVQEMNKTMIVNHNSVVKSDDTIYMLGDVALGHPKHLKPILERLNGHKILIIGSHDKTTLQYKKYFDHISSRMDITINGHHIALCHYCMRTWSRSHWNSYMLYGHSHGTLDPIGKSWDVGVDKNNFTPLSLEQIIKIMKNRPDNPNLIRRR